MQQLYRKLLHLTVRFLKYRRPWLERIQVSSLINQLAEPRFGRQNLVEEPPVVRLNLVPHLALVGIVDWLANWRARAEPSLH
jgi:hypothetical protein